MPAIRVHNLSKTYRYHHKQPGMWGSIRSLVQRQTLEKHAVDSVSFSIEAGEVVGFLGPNGAGKTTTLKMLCGLLYPSGGSASVLGYTPSRRQPDFLRRIALVMGQKNMLWWDLPAMDTLLLHRDMYGVEEGRFRQLVRDLSRMLDVEGLLDVQVRKLSLGERMKMELLTALIHDPDVLFLDEPTIGLDVVSQQRVREFLARLNRERGTTILLTSHYMDDIEALCPRVLVIDHGRLHFDGLLMTLVERSATHKQITVLLREPLGEAEEHLLRGLQISPSHDPLQLRLSVLREDVARIASGLLLTGQVADLSIEEAPVEEIVRHIFSAPAPERVVG